MKKLIVSLLIICLLCCSGCLESETLESRAEQGFIDYIDLTNDVIADENTHILYIYRHGNNTAYICPYYSKNGKLCRYEDGKIIEVEE